MTSTPRAQPVTGPLLREAVARLLGAGSPALPEAVSRFVQTAPAMGIDLELLSATVSLDAPQGRRVRQVCLPVVGAGRTVMLFLSQPGPRPGFGPPEEQREERRLTVLGALERCIARHGTGVHLAQALAEPAETWAADAYTSAGLRQIAELLYLSRPMSIGEHRSVSEFDTGPVEPPSGEVWPPEIGVRRYRPGEDDKALADALEASYASTLDCPELAGLRSMTDILEAHRAVGEFDASLWWLVERAGVAEGCVLLNRCGSQACVELVYIGLSPAVRGLGLGRRLLRQAIAATAALEREVRCAVDSRNTPARRVYESLGFRVVGRRAAFVALVEELVARKSDAR
ncbi:MAG: GNAT family N-acetyltransferase [Phycisphaerales bacterium]|nr:GNAT family N-acetyltransferase [Phycisphaerales bacterium]